MKLSEELKARGFINQISGESLEVILDGPKRVVYHGIDPTADSAHAGNFANWILLKHLLNHGHKIIFLVGGGTGMIGDPKPDAERELSGLEEVEARVIKLKAQAENLLDSQEIEFVNNYDWLGDLNLIEFLRDIGKHFTVGELLKKEAIANRMSSEVGLSYTEFAYPLLQAFDYLQLNRTRGCDLQIGGSDQWGNIVAGVDLVRRLEQKTVYALTQPLVIDKSTGKKFGKSEGNAVWLDAEMTSPYQFYQFWFNTADENVVDYLKRFTFLSLSEINEVEANFDTDPASRIAQKKLAEAVTSFVHGEEATKQVIVVSEILFGEGSLSDLNDGAKELLLANAPVAYVKDQDSLVDVLEKSQLASSRREARTFIETGAITFSKQKVESSEIAMQDLSFENNLAVLRRGKKNLCILVRD